MKCIALIGYMCVGKTTVGRALARQLNCRFYDLDWYIEERFHKRISQIFAEDGEARFRDLERRMLHEVAEFEDIVLACGGGTPTFFDNMDYLNEVAHTVYLQASPETICAHLEVSKGKRPLLEGKSPGELAAFVDAQLLLRSPFYEKAQHTIRINFLDSFDKIEEISQNIRQLLFTSAFPHSNRQNLR